MGFLCGSHRTYGGYEGPEVVYVYEGAIKSISMFYMCVGVGAGQHKYMSSLVSVLWLWLRVDLSPKLNFHSSLLLLSSLNLSPLPTARHFCFHIADFSGNTLIFEAFGVGSRVRLSSFFTLTYPSTQIELFSHFLSSLLNHLPMPYLPIMSNFIVKATRAKHHVLL